METMKVARMMNSYSVDGQDERNYGIVVYRGTCHNVDYHLFYCYATFVIRTN